jgi:uncharacterized metal-binding protein YceD (DUF177 family)
VTKASFVVPLADIERGPRTVTFTLDEPWLSQALEGTEATPRRAGSATVELSKNGKDVMVRGRAEAPLSMPCVVTLDPLDIDVSTEIFLMLSPAPSEVSPKLSKKGRGAPVQPKEGNEAPAAGRGAATRKRSAKDEEEEGELLDDRAAARDTFEGSQIELDPFFREFIVLELPMFPRRSDLPSSEGPAIGAPPADSGEPEPVIDPRLQPLAALRSRMRESKE